jgi:hypothetical protein
LKPFNDGSAGECASQHLTAAREKPGGEALAPPAGVWTFFAAGPMLSQRLTPGIAAQRLNRLAQAAVATAMAPLMLWYVTPKKPAAT